MYLIRCFDIRYRCILLRVVRILTSGQNRTRYPTALVNGFITDLLVKEGECDSFACARRLVMKTSTNNCAISLYI